MANMFSIPVLNSFRWVNQNPTYDVRYNKLPFDELTDQNSYPQKWQTNDVVPIQILSDFVPTLNIFTCDDIFIANIPLTPTANGIKDQTFLCYEGEVDFSGYQHAYYYAKLTYIDENGTTQDIRSCPLDVDTLHEGTSLIQYKNSQNDKGVIFDTGIEFCLRIECNFDEFAPRAKTSSYEDQKYNGMLLNGIPYRTFVLYFGSTYVLGETTLIPDWIVDKLNVIFTCDQVQVDGQYYIRFEDAEFKPYKAGNSYPNDGFWSLEVQHVPNFDLRKYTSGSTPQGNLRVVRDAIERNNISAGFSVSGLFTDNMNLTTVALWNYGGQNFIVRFGTTPNGNDIGQFTIPLGQLTNALKVEHVFNSATTVYVSFTDLAGNIITGVNCKFWMAYDKYDAPSLNAPNPTVGRYPKNSFGYYYETSPGELNLDWDLASGVGRVGRPFENCVIIDAAKDLYVKIWDRNDISAFQTQTGNVNGQVTLTRAVLPADGIPMFADQFNGATNQKPNANQTVAITGASGTIGYELERATVPATIGKSGNLGDGDPLNIEPRSIILLAFIAIAN